MRGVTAGKRTLDSGSHERALGDVQLETGRDKWTPRVGHAGRCRRGWPQPAANRQDALLLAKHFDTSAEVRMKPLVVEELIKEAGARGRRTNAVFAPTKWRHGVRQVLLPVQPPLTVNGGLHFCLAMWREIPPDRQPAEADVICIVAVDARIRRACRPPADLCGDVPVHGWGRR